MGFKRKFKDGDTVRVTDPNNSNYKKIGIIKWYGYPLYIKNAYFKKKIYYVDFKTYSHEFYSHQLEKVEDSSDTDTKSNKLSISDLKPGIKVRIRPDLKEGYNPLIYVSDSMTYFKGTIQTIKTINSNNTIILNSLNYSWDIDCFSEIVEEPKEEVKTSEKVELPLKEGQIVTLLDGKQYKVMPYKGHKSWACEKCSLFINDCSCQTTYLNETTSCTEVINNRKNYFKLIDYCLQDINKKATFSTISDFKVENGNTDKSTNSSNSIENSSVKEIGIITKVNFTLTDFKPEKLEYSKFTIL